MSNDVKVELTVNLRPPEEFIEAIKSRYGLTDEDLKNHAVILNDAAPYDLETVQVVKLPQDSQLNVILSGVEQLSKKCNLTLDQHNEIAQLAIKDFNVLAVDGVDAGERINRTTATIREAVRRMVPVAASSAKPNRRQQRRMRQGKQPVAVGRTTKDKRRALADALKKGTAKFVQRPDR